MNARQPITILATTMIFGLVLDTPIAMAAFVPHGTYAQTCRDIHVNGPYLEAACARADGSWRRTRIFAPRCAGIEISNQNGRLTCGE